MVRVWQSSLPNPSTMRVGLKANGRIALHQGAVDIGQGANTIVTQICADALGAPIDRFDLVSGDTSITPDSGKTSASRQTFVAGKAVYMAAKELRCAILGMTGACECAVIDFGKDALTIKEDGKERTIHLRDQPLDKHGYVFTGEATFARPPARWMKTVKASRMQSSASGLTSQRLRLIPNWELCVC